MLDAFEHLVTQAHQFDLHRLHQFTTGVGQAQAFGPAILGIFGAADVAGMAQLIEQTHQRRTLHPGGLRHPHLAHALAQAADHQQRHGAGFGDSVVDQRGLADLPPMPGGHHHGTADVHLESVEFVRHEEMHTVSLLTINIALEGNFSQVLKQIAPLVARNKLKLSKSCDDDVYTSLVPRTLKESADVKTSRFYNEA
ncbi:hypothetical protein EMIT0P265_80033 [Pseudomonas zeae]